MTAAAFLEKAVRNGIWFTVKDDQLLVDAPGWVLTDRVRQAIRRHKEELLLLLADDPYADPGEEVGAASH